MLRDLLDASAARSPVREISRKEEEVVVPWWGVNEGGISAKLAGLWKSGNCIFENVG